MKPFALLEAAKRAAPNNPFVQSCVKYYVKNGKLSPDQLKALQRTVEGRKSNNIQARAAHAHEPVTACTVRPRSWQYV